MKKCTVFANEVLLYAWIACHVVLFLSAGVVWWLYEQPSGVWMMLLPICSIVINCFETERWCLMLTFDRDGVLYKQKQSDGFPSLL